MSEAPSKHNRIYAVVRAIPSGRVLTYGDVAALADLPGHARLVGYALHALPEHTAVPWHRVINRNGGISTGRAWPGGDLLQRRLLEAEGVEFDANGRTSLRRYRWTGDSELLAEQQAYYRARAAEYDEWFLRQGRYDRGEEWNGRWFAEVDELKRALESFRPTGSVLELAGGTGWWTEELLRYATELTVVDSSAEVIGISRARVGADARVAYVQADLFEWTPEDTYDVVFFSFWLSHVPPERFAAFWQRVRAALRPDGRVFFIDSLRTETSTARNHQLPEPEDSISVRKLNDGREFRVVKIFYDPGSLRGALEGLGWEASVARTDNFFLYGSAHPA